MTRQLNSTTWRNENPLEGGDCAYLTSSFLILSYSILFFFSYFISYLIFILSECHLSLSFAQVLPSVFFTSVLCILASQRTTLLRLIEFYYRHFYLDFPSFVFTLIFSVYVSYSVLLAYEPWRCTPFSALGRLDPSAKWSTISLKFVVHWFYFKNQNKYTPKFVCNDF